MLRQLANLPSMAQVHQKVLLCALPVKGTERESRDPFLR